MRFLPLQLYTSPDELYSGIPRLEHYIELTKHVLDESLPTICFPTTTNLPKEQCTALTRFKKTRQNLTVKPADKNLGIVVMNTDDYITQCMAHLTDPNTYRRTTEYPINDIQRQLLNTLVRFKNLIQTYDKHLYKYLTGRPNNSQTPQFYGIPKIHKSFSHLPPMRPIVSHSNSALAPTARFIDHVLQPLARSYPDYLHNSTSLSILLQDLHVPDDAILVTIDVASLYPSIPQTECLQIIYNEMHSHRHLLLFDPNLVIQLLHTNINYNYFEFAQLNFQQIKGTAMGATFSPTIANIFMSVILRNFLRSQPFHPLQIVRYIDDIFMIWPNNTDRLNDFLSALNTFHPHLRFTHQQSPHTIDFLDLTIYKSFRFYFTNILDTRTFQKSQNLYQYLHYTSAHPNTVFKALILGECVRYVRTNTKRETYMAMIQEFKTRLRRRDYPHQLIRSTTAIVKYQDRHLHLQRSQPTHPLITPPLFKCLPPPQFKILKTVILRNYPILQQRLPNPRFIALRHRTLRQDLVRAKTTPTDDQLIDIILTLGDTPSGRHITAGSLPPLRTRSINISPCNRPRCATCTHHLNRATVFKCTRTGITYPIRRSFSCISKNLIYLITCTKCKKQYVGFTTQQLNTRINHHRTNIITKQRIYLCVHFNFPDHSLNNLTVQPIDGVTDSPKALQELRQLEKYWIKTLKTVQPLGLNNSLGYSSN